MQNAKHAKHARYAPVLVADAGVRTGSSKIRRSTCKMQDEKKKICIIYPVHVCLSKVWVQEHKKKKERSTCKTFPTEGRSPTWTALHRKLMIQMHSYCGKKWERPSDEWGDNWEEGKEETMLTAVSWEQPPDLHSKLLKYSISDELLMKYLSCWKNIYWEIMRKYIRDAIISWNT